MNIHRKEERLLERRPVRVCVVDHTGLNTSVLEFTGTTLDLSADGACIEGSPALPKDATLELSLTFEGFPFDFLQWAQVRWIENVPDRGVFRMGIEFIRATPQVREVWVAFLQSLRKRDAQRVAAFAPS